MSKPLDIDLSGDDELNLGWIVGKRYRVWTGDVDIILGYNNGWVIVMDEKTGDVRGHLTQLYSNDQLVGE